MAAANATPTAIPSGILCKVTANTNMLVRDNLLCGPSGEGLPKWRCGVIRSISKRNAIPAMKPLTAGITRVASSVPLISIEGISSDHTEAATMTPEANPNKVFCTKSGICFFIRKTQAAPKVVPAKGNNNPMISPSIILYLSFVGIIPT